MNRLYLLVALALVLIALGFCAVFAPDLSTGLLALATALVGALAGTTWPATPTGTAELEQTAPPVAKPPNA